MTAAETRASLTLRKIFPERQIYIRSDGHVQFWTFGSSIQAVLAAMALFLFGCAGFATVMVIFKDRSIAARDERYERTQAAYEDRIFRLRTAYGDLRGALAQSERQFDATVGDVEKKQGLIAGLAVNEDAVEGRAGNSSAGVPPQLSEDMKFSPSYTVSQAVLPSPDDGKNRIPQGTGSRMVLAGTGLFRDLISRLLATSALLISRHDGYAGTAAKLSNPALIALGRQTERMRLLDISEDKVLEGTGQLFSRRIGELRDVIRHTGVDPNELMGKLVSQHGVGGPEIPIDQVQIVGIADRGFTRAYLNAAAALNQIGLVSDAVRHMPLSLPVRGFDRTSGFGMRLDPFTGRYAFHPGQDFGGPWGAPVVATAPGVVVFAGDRGSYGMTVEIDHGMGFHTRYAHLSAIAVRSGAVVEKGTMIGKVGSTGRSTGPHVHYEVWYNDVVRNPAAFIAASGGFSSRVDHSFDAVGAKGQD